MKQGIIIEAKYENKIYLLDKSIDRVIRRAKPIRKSEIHFKFSTPLSLDSTISYARRIERHPSPLLSSTSLTHSKPSED